MKERPIQRGAVETGAKTGGITDDGWGKRKQRSGGNFPAGPDVRIYGDRKGPGKEETEMKKRIRVWTACLLAAVLTLAATCALAETKITVSGTGETQVRADTAVISLGVNARDRDVLQAQKKVNGAIAAIRAALIARGVPEEDINTDYMNIYAVYDYENDQEQVKAYDASSVLAVRVTDMDSIGRLIDAAFAAGANTLNGIAFSAADTGEARAESLRKAAADAREKAEILAEASGMKITGVEIITEGNVYSYDNTVGNFSAKAMDRDEAGGAGTVVQAAKLIISATVSMTFSAE